MAKKKSEFQDSVSEDTSEDQDFFESDPVDQKTVAASPARAPSRVRAVVKPAKRMNFDRYAKRKGIKATHIPGMRAFVKNPRTPRTEAEWDKYFEKY